MMARYKSGIYPINTLYARHLVKMLGIVRDKDDYHCLSIISLLASHSRSLCESERPCRYAHKLFNANVVISQLFIDSAAKIRRISEICKFSAKKVFTEGRPSMNTCPFFGI